MPRLTAVDAQWFWMSAKIPNDQFLIYAFDGDAPIGPDLLAGLRTRAAACEDLTLRVVDDCALRYPRWESGPVLPEQIVVHPDACSWSECLDAVAGLADHQLDPRAAAWRLHLFGPITGAPTGHATVTVAVLQMLHSLADGTRSAKLGGWLFGREEPIEPLPAPSRGSRVLRGIRAARAQRELTADIDAGRVTVPPPPRPPLLTNTAPSGPRRLRFLVTDRAALSSVSTVTVGALLAIGAALAEHLRQRGVDPADLAAEAPMANPWIRESRNHFRSVGIGLHPDEPIALRAERIVAQFRAAAIRGQHPAAEASAAASATVPAALLRWGVGKFDAGARSPAVTGNTVVSSVNRGPADLRLGTAPVVLTAGFPALSPMMGLTHGVYGIGDTIVVAVHASDSVMTEAQLDDYVDTLTRALATGEAH